MDTSKLKKFAQQARRLLMEQVAAKLALVTALDSAAQRERTVAVQKLEEQIAAQGEAQVIEQVAYTWFNRFCALRFMDVKRYSRIGVLSPLSGQFQPEILAEAKGGYVDEDVVKGAVREQIFALLDGSAPSVDGQAEAYRLLIVAVCNDYHRIMPYLFERIDDYTELLMPDDLLSGNSIVAYTREAMTPDACKDVEVIGWLYQFYISEKKDEVFAGLKKKKKKITPENIPAATQLFTPHWIVRYLVENSLGRLWLLNRPKSGLRGRMDYYIEPEQVETDFLRVVSPEDLKICDPACGSGHMLVYAFDLLFAIYEEEGYAPEEIPGRILACNLYGIEIDNRAGALAAFALTMKARERQRIFFRRVVEPNICVLENVQFGEGELNEYMDFIGRDLFTAPLIETLHQFKEADNLGSLIQPVVPDVKNILALLEEKDVAGQLLLYPIHQKALKVLKQSDYLAPKYHVVVANPPYMGGKGMNGCLSAYARANYSKSKSDLFSMFIERSLSFTSQAGYSALITMQSWMFLSSFSKFRQQIFRESTIVSMAHLGARAFDSIGGEVVSTTAFVLMNSYYPDLDGSYFRLVDRNSEIEKDAAIRKAIEDPNCGYCYYSSTKKLSKLPDRTVTYWASPSALEAFSALKSLGEVAEVKAGMSTSNNNRFLRYWYEVPRSNSNYKCWNAEQAEDSGAKWFPFHKGGGYRSWYGNLEYLVNWKRDGQEIKQAVVSNAGDPDTNHWSRRIYNTSYYFKPCVTWSLIGGNNVSFRFSTEGAIISHKGPGVYFGEHSYEILNLLNSKTTEYFLGLMRQSLGIEVGHVSKIPVPHVFKDKHKPRQVDIAKEDWDSFETSWDFSRLPLLSNDYENDKIEHSYKNLHIRWQNITSEMHFLEEENNSTFIERYGLQSTLTPDVCLAEITLTCNPHHRYDSTKPEPELEALLLADTMREFISYAVGCMFGRYSLDSPGLILANQGETLTDYLTCIPNPTFTPDADNVIPILEGEWFTDDITERFYTFLRTTFGPDHYTDNLKFIEAAIGKPIRKFFLSDFYKDHIKRYKRRPIYWLFSSPKGTFNALIYMHRYRPDTVSVILNDYLREFQNKLTARQSYLETISISASATTTEKDKAFLEIEKLKKDLTELKDYERQTLYPLATPANRNRPRRWRKGKLP